MRRHRVPVWAWLVVALVTVVAACAVPHTMAPRSYQYHCPAVAAAPASGTITWLGPSLTGDSAAIALWCQTVGPPVIDSIPAARRAGGALDSLVVVTWNVAGGSGDIPGFLADELGWVCDGAASHARPGALPFVILAQEAFRRSPSVPPFPEGETVPLRIPEEPRDGPRRDIVATARACGLALFFAPSMRNGADEYPDGREDKGNALLANVPLHDFLAVELPFETQRRVAVGATVRTPAGDSVRIVNLHLDVSPGLWRVLKTGNSSRLRQAMGVVDALARVEQARSGRPQPLAEGCEHVCEDTTAAHAIATVVAGDLNTWSGDQTVIQHLVTWFPQSPPDDGLPTRGEFPADHMFFRHATVPAPLLVPESYRRIDASHHSDHLARRFVLAFAP